MKTKTIIYIIIGVVVLYLAYRAYQYYTGRSAYKASNNGSGGTSQYKNIAIPSGSIFKNAEIKGNGNVAFKDTPKNQFDSGRRFAKNGEYKILAVVDRSNEQITEFSKPMDISGFSVNIGTIVDIELIKDVTENSIPTQLIIMT